MRAHFRLLLPGVAATLLLLLSCGGVTSSNPALPGNPANPNSPCPRPPRPSFYSSQMLLGADIMDGTHLLWAYRIDNQTGALEEMPWSPLPTFRHPRVFAADAHGRFLYVGSENSLLQRSRVIEVFQLGAADEAPSQTQVHDFGHPSDLAFDTTGNHLYALDTVGLPEESTLHTFALNCDGTIEEAPPPARVTRFANSFAFKSSDQDQFALVAREDRLDQHANNVHVFRRDPATGLLAEVSASSFTNTAVRFLAVPEQGRFFMGTKCGSVQGAARGAQVFSFDAHPVAVAALPDGFYSGICWAFFDRSGSYVAAVELLDPELQTSRQRVLAIYRVDSNTGSLSQTDRQVLPDTIGRLAFDLNNRYLYASVITSPSRTVHAFAFDVSAGSVTPVPGSPFVVPKTFRPMFVIGRP